MTTSTRRPRVLWLTKGLAIGGSERLLVAAARTLDHERVDIEAAYVLKHANHLVSSLRERGINVRVIGGDHTIDPRWVAGLHRLLRHGDYDVVHMHSPLVAGVARALVHTLPRKRRPALVSTEHGPWWSYSLPTRLINAVLYGQDNVKLAVSNGVRNSVWPRFRGDVEVLVHGFVLNDLPQPSEQLRQSARQHFGIPSDGLLAVTIANYRPQKAYPDLLEAARIVKERDDRVRFISAGHGPLMQQVRSLHAKMGLGDTVRLLGPQMDVFTILAAGDLFVLPSHWEGGPVAVMEALAMGLPIVATHVGFMDEIVTDGIEGFLVPPARPDLLANRILELAANPQLRAQMSSAAYGKRLQFDMQRVSARLDEIYHELARTRHRVRRRRHVRSLDQLKESQD